MLLAPRPRLPEVVEERLAERRTQLDRHVHGDVLDLRDPEARESVLAAAQSRVAPTRRFDTIVSIVELVRFPDVTLALEGIARLLTPDGAFLFIEPTRHPSAASPLLATLWSSHPAVAGSHLERDVPRAVRAAGLVISDLERFTVPTSVYPLRVFAHGRSLHSVESVAA